MTTRAKAADPAPIACSLHGLGSLLVAMLICATSTSHAQSVLPMPTGTLYGGDTVHAIVVQANGKVVIGGSFSAVNNVPRANIARLNTDGSVDLSWNPGADGAVQALADSGNAIYVGGSFSQSGGQLRSRLAAIDAKTALATNWNPNVDPYGYIGAIALSGGTIYVGGSFTQIEGQQRANIAAIDAITGQTTSWNPGADDTVKALALSGNTVYVGGAFLNIGSHPRSNIAAIDASTGQATTWNPNVDDASPGSWVQSVVLSGNTVYAAGNFWLIGGQLRDGIAAIDATSGQATAWNPVGAGSGGGVVLSIAVSGNTVYAGGAFSHIGGQPRSNIAAIDATTGLATTWYPRVDNEVESIALSGNILYVGGYFSHVNLDPRNAIAALTTTEQIFSDGFEPQP